MGTVETHNFVLVCSVWTARGGEPHVRHEFVRNALDLVYPSVDSSLCHPSNTPPTEALHTDCDAHRACH